MKYYYTGIDVYIENVCTYKTQLSVLFCMIAKSNWIIKISVF